METRPFGVLKLKGIYKMKKIISKIVIFIILMGIAFSLSGCLRDLFMEYMGITKQLDSYSKETQTLISIILWGMFIPIWVVISVVWELTEKIINCFNKK